MISASLLGSYLYCARKLYLERVLGLAEPPKDVLVKGSIRHKAYEDINKVEERIVRNTKRSVDLAQLMQIYKQEHSRILRDAIIGYKGELRRFNISMIDMFKQAWPLILPDSEARASNIFNFMQKNKVYGAELWDVLVPKIQSELRIESQALGLKGIIDEVHVYPDGYVPFELKTGRMPKEGVWPSHKIQLGAYALLLEDKFNVDVKEGFVKYLDTRKECHIVVNPFLKDEVKGLIESVNLLMVSKELPEICSNENKCDKCGLRSECHDSVTLKRKIEEKVKQKI